MKNYYHLTKDIDTQECLILAFDTYIYRCQWDNIAFSSTYMIWEDFLHENRNRRSKKLKTINNVLLKEVRDKNANSK